MSNLPTAYSKMVTIKVGDEVKQIFKNNTASGGSSIFIYHTENSALEINDFNGVLVTEDYADVGIIRYLGKDLGEN